MENAQIETFEIEPVDTASTRWERWVRRFANFVVAKGINNDARIKAMMLHHAGETVFELSESVGVLDTDTYAVAREKLTAYFTPRRNTEYEIFVFRQTQQLPGGGETLDQFHARLLQLSKNCNFVNRDGEIRSQIIQKCAMAKIRDKGLSEADITLEQLLRYGRTLESTIQQSLVMSNSAHATSTTAQNVNTVSSRQQQSSGKTSQGASSDYSNQRRHDDRLGQHHPHRSRGGQGTSMNTRQRAPPRNANAASGHSDARFCPGCGNSPHHRTECRAWGKICFKCEKRNHFANVCRSTTANTNLVVNVEQPLSQTDADLSELSLYNTNTQHRDMVKPYECTIKVYSMPVTMEIDTGCLVSLLSHTEWARIKEGAPKLTLDTQNVPCLRTYSGHTIQPLGWTLLDVYHNDTHYQLYALVVPGTGPNLLGRDWLSVLQLNWAKLYVDETMQPRYCKPRPVPLALRAKVESELDRLQEEGVIRPVEFSEWAAPIVPVLKASGDIRICGDYKVDKHPSSRISHADCMSRLPLPDAPSHFPVPREVVLALSTLDETPINSDQIEKWTSADPVLSQVRRFVEQGWSDQTPPEFDCYRHRKDELSVQQGVLFWGARVIIPPKGRDALLRELHDTHPGIVKMKALARSYLWWPGLDTEIERHVKDCNACQIYSRQHDLLRPSIQDNVLQKQAYDKQRHDTHAAARTFRTGDSAWALNFQGKPKWMPTVIESQLGPLTFTVRLSDGRLWKRHQDHLRERRPDETESVGAAQPRPEVLLPPPPLPQLTSTDKERDVTPLTSATTSNSASARVPESPAANRMPPRETVVPIIAASPVRRSTRVTKAPVKLNL